MYIEINIKLIFLALSKLLFRIFANSDVIYEASTESTESSAVQETGNPER